MAPLVHHLACRDVFDPLRPQCRYDPMHVVPHLKALHKHEKKCHANPANSLLPATDALATTPMTTTPTATAPLVLFAEAAASDVESLSFSSLDSSPSCMSNLSFDDEPSNQQSDADKDVSVDPEAMATLSIHNQS